MKLCGFDVGLDQRFFLIAGTCSIEGLEMSIDVAGQLKEACTALGIPLIAFGAWIGVTRWYDGYLHNTPATSGTVMLAALPVLVGIQLVLAFLSYDLQNVPREVLHRRLDPPA